MCIKLSKKKCGKILPCHPLLPTLAPYQPVHRRSGSAGYHRVTAVSQVHVAEWVEGEKLSQSQAWPGEAEKSGGGHGPGDTVDG